MPWCYSSVFFVTTNTVWLSQWYISNDVFPFFLPPLPHATTLYGKDGKGKFKLDLGLKLPKVNLGFVKGEEEEEEVVRIAAEFDSSSVFHLTKSVQWEQG